MSSLKVAHLPWDPAPPAPAPTASQTLPSNARLPSQTLPSNGNTVSTPPSSSSTPGPQIKQDPSTVPTGPSPANQYSIPMQYPPGVQLNARQRAAANLHNAYGIQAGPQIAQLQQGNIPRIPMPAQPMNMVKQEDQKPQMSSLPEYQSAPSQPPVPPIKSSQNDGSGDVLLDWQEEATRRRQLAARHRGEADRLMHDQFLYTQSRLEGGGLMLPLNERSETRLAVKRGHQNRNSAVTPHEASSSLGQAQGDAAADEERPIDEDEDAINSDLDDPNDQVDDDENEDIEQVMLCTYDKVQRVKNKWKCTLKDGILKVDGSE